MEKPQIPTPLLGLTEIRGDTPEEFVLWKSFRGYEFFVKHGYPEAPKWEWIILDSTSTPTEFGEVASFEEAEVALADAGARLLPDSAPVVPVAPSVAAAADSSPLPVAAPVAVDPTVICSCHTCSVLQILRELVSQHSTHGRAPHPTQGDLRGEPRS